MATKKPLRSGLKSLLKEEALTDWEVAHLEAMIDSPSVQIKASGATRVSRLGYLVAGCILAGILSVAISLLWWQKGETTQELVAQEVLTNHLKISKLDLETSSIYEVRTFFDRLNFSPFFSVMLERDDLRLLGARYCTLQGVIALQMRFRAVDGEVVTYYQALYDKQRFGRLPDIKAGEKPQFVEAQGFAMSIWREESVAIVLAQARP